LWLLALLWSAKESALKLLREGLRLDTRHVVVSFLGEPEFQTDNQENFAQRDCVSIRTSSQHNCWSPLQVCHANAQIFNGWWSQTGDLLRTVLAAPPADPPVVLAQRVLSELLM
jgi:4'-phosphopantetheinyl transferase